MPTDIKPIGLQQPTLVSLGIAGLGRAPRSEPVSAIGAKSEVKDDVNVRHTPTPLQDVLHSEAKVHEAVQFFHQAGEALSAMGIAQPDGASQSPAMETAFAQIKKLAESMSEARRAVLSKPIPNREAAEYIAKMIAEHAGRDSDVVAAIAQHLPDHVLALTS